MDLVGVQHLARRVRRGVAASCCAGRAGVPDACRRRGVDVAVRRAPDCSTGEAAPAVRALLVPRRGPAPVPDRCCGDRFDDHRGGRGAGRLRRHRGSRRPARRELDATAFADRQQLHAIGGRSGCRAGHRRADPRARGDVRLRRGARAQGQVRRSLVEPDGRGSRQASESSTRRLFATSCPPRTSTGHWPPTGRAASSSGESARIKDGKAEVLVDGIGKRQRWKLPAASTPSIHQFDDFAAGLDQPGNGQGARAADGVLPSGRARRPLGHQRRPFPVGGQRHRRMVGGPTARGAGVGLARCGGCRRAGDGPRRRHRSRARRGGGSGRRSDARGGGGEPTESSAVRCRPRAVPRPGRWSARPRDRRAGRAQLRPARRPSAASPFPGRRWPAPCSSYLSSRRSQAGW